MPPILILALKAIVTLGAIPILAAPYIEYGKGPNGKPIRKWSYGNLYFWLILLAISIDVGLERYGSEHAIDDSHSPLTFLDNHAYEEDLAALSPPLNATEQQELRRHFEHAEYAWSRHDYDEAAKALLALAAGKDSFGSFRQLSSATVSNDLGCVFFKLQRNKEFKASQYLFEAKSLSRGSQNADVIERNLQHLDTLVNTLD
jgi:hypothetical protein